MNTEIEKWKLKRLLKTLDSMEGAGTSLITLLIRPGDQVSQWNKLLTEESGAASNIKSRVNRLSVQNAIVTAQQKLKLYSKIPPNGLAIFCGTTSEKQVRLAVEPFKPLNTQLYLCDSKFHTDSLKKMLDDDETYGFIVMDGHGTLFGTVCGMTKNVLGKHTVRLPPKHGRGGQSAPRFARLREEARVAYMYRMAEYAAAYFISDDRLNIKHLIMAGCAQFKQELADSDKLDPRLKSAILTIVDVAYGNENGFDEAIRLSQDKMRGVQLSEQKLKLQGFFDAIACNTGTICYGEVDVVRALEMGAAEYILMHDNFVLWRNVFIDVDGKEIVGYTKKQLFASEEDVCKKLQSSEPFSEWLVETHEKQFGAQLVLISDATTEGTMFCNGFGGLAGVLRYKVEFEHFDVSEGSAKSEDGSFNSESDFM